MQPSQSDNSNTARKTYPEQRKPLLRPLMALWRKMTKGALRPPRIIPKGGKLRQSDRVSGFPPVEVGAACSLMLLDDIG